MLLSSIKLGRNCLQHGNLTMSELQSEHTVCCSLKFTGNRLFDVRSEKQGRATYCSSPHPLHVVLTVFSSTQISVWQVMHGNCIVICHQFCELSICVHISVEQSLLFCVVVVSVVSKVLIVFSNKCGWGTLLCSLLSGFSFTQIHRLIRTTTVRINAVQRMVTRSFRLELTGRLISSLASKLWEILFFF